MITTTPFETDLGEMEKRWVDRAVAAIKKDDSELVDILQNADYPKLVVHILHLAIHGG